jgi:hypothetical protein
MKLMLLLLLMAIIIVLASISSPVRRAEIEPAE